MSDGVDVVLLPCCSQCIHRDCLSQFLVSARLNLMQQQSPAAEQAHHCCPACKQPVELLHNVATAVDLAVTAAVNDAAAVAHAEMSTKIRREAEERSLPRSPVPSACLPTDFTARNTSCTHLVTPLDHDSHAPPSSYHVFAADALAAKFGPSACAHAYKNDVHLG